ncbi:MAG: HAD family hydrolase [Gammaproteobacteria bacterium]
MEASSLVNVKTARTTVHASDLLASFDSYADNLKVLSIDCFDTLIWRKVASPNDLFYDLAQQPFFKSLGITALQRFLAESHARKIAFLHKGCAEVQLQDIYQVGFPHLNEDIIERLVEEEIQLEMQICYAFLPVINLIRTAKQRNLKVIIVSNTYLSFLQLRRLLNHVLPTDVLHAIDDIYCSCEFNISKSEGLFIEVLQKLNVPPQAILHIGDNKPSDVDSPKTLKINAWHFLPYEKKLLELLRLQATSAMLADGTIRHTHSLVNPFGGVLGMMSETAMTPDGIIGYASLGPVMYAFAQYILDCINELKRTEKSLKTLFLLRDAHLPYLACEALTGAAVGQCVQISRFTAIAASFRTEQDLIDYFRHDALTQFNEICQQLLLPKDLTDSIIQHTLKSPHPSQTFIQLILQDKVKQVIFANSKQHRQKLLIYLEKTAQLKAGDSLLLVDIGYVGRTQRALAPILRDELLINKVHGCYLMMFSTLEDKSTRQGLLDASWCDDRILHTLGTSFAFMEEFCCNDSDSVIDYDAQGNATTSASHIKREQRDKVKRIQSECIRFIHDARRFFQESGITLSPQFLREAARAELMRRVYLPMDIEVEYLQNFYHDVNQGVNLGARASFCIFDNPAASLNSLRSQGLLFKNRQPYGMRATSLDLVLTLLLQRRFNLDICLSDLSLRREWVQVITLQNQISQTQTMCATPTYDGYFSVWFSVGKGNMQVAILTGLTYKCLQLDSAQLIKASGFLTDREPEYAQNVIESLVFNHMVGSDGKIYECTQNTSSILLSIPPLDSSEEMIFRLVFRPLVRR